MMGIYICVYAHGSEVCVFAFSFLRFEVFSHVRAHIGVRGFEFACQYGSSSSVNLYLYAFVQSLN